MCTCSKCEVTSPSGFCLHAFPAMVDCTYSNLSQINPVLPKAVSYWVYSYGKKENKQYANTGTKVRNLNVLTSTCVS